MVFLVLEGFSGTGKTTLAKGLEERGWLRLQESAHAVPDQVPVADRADTFADYSLLGATMVYSSIISKAREKRNIVSEGYLLSDLAYARIRFDLKKSKAFPSMLNLCREILTSHEMKPDLYVILQAKPETIEHSRIGKNKSENNMTEFFKTRYYKALSEMHEELGEKNVKSVYTGNNLRLTLDTILDALKKRKVVR
jgi:thymidylate kinase